MLTQRACCSGSPSDSVSKTTDFSLPQTSRSDNVGNSSSPSGSSTSGLATPVYPPKASIVTLPISNEPVSSATPLSSNLKNVFVDMYNQIPESPFFFPLQPNVIQVSQPSLSPHQNYQHLINQQPQQHHSKRLTNEYFNAPASTQNHQKISQPTNASFLYKTDPILQVSQTQHFYSRALTSPDIYRQPTVPHEEELSIQKPIVQGSSVENILGVCIQRFNDCHIESNIHGKGTCKLSTIVLEYAKIYEPLAFAVGNLGSKWLPTLQPDLSEMFVDFKIKALNLLRQDLAYRGISEPSLLCMLILGIIEMNEFNNEAWNQHLDGSAKGITDMLQKKPDIMENLDNYPNFVIILDNMALLDIIYALVTTSKPRMCLIYQYYQSKLRIKGPCILNADSVHSPIAPIVMAVNDLLCFASDLQNQFPSITFELGAKYPAYYAVDKSYYTADHHRRYASLLNDIETFSNIEEKDMTSMWEMVSSSKQVTLIYFMLRLDANEFQLQLSPKIRKIRDQGLILISQTPLYYMKLKVHSVAIWLLGITAEDKADRDRLLMETKQIASHTLCPTLSSVTHFLNVFWKKRDSPEYKNFTYRDLLSVTTEETKFRLIH